MRRRGGPSVLRHALTEDDAPGWGALLDPLASLTSINLPTDRGLAALPTPAADAGARRHAELGGALVRSLQGMMDVHAAIEAASPCGLPKDCLPIGRIKAAELLPSHVLGPELGPMQLPLYEKVMASQQAAAYAYLLAIADLGDAAAPETSDADEDHSLVALGDWSAGGASGAACPPGSSAGEGRGLASACGGDAASMGESELRSSFKRLYMEMLTEDAADDLDGLRQAEALDEASLSLLVDALESGADTFDDETRALAIESYDGTHSWMARARQGSQGVGPRGGREACCGEYGGSVSDSAVMARAAAVEAEISGLRGGKPQGPKAASSAQGAGAAVSRAGPRTQATGGVTELSGAAKAGKPRPSPTGSSARAASGASSGKASKERKRKSEQ